MLPRNELGAEALTVKVVESVPITTIADLALAEREKSGFPVPVRETLCGLLAASSVTLRAPVRLPLAVGVKVTLAVQLSPLLRTMGSVPKVLVSAKSPVALMSVWVAAPG